MSGWVRASICVDVGRFVSFFLCMLSSWVFDVSFYFMFRDFLVVAVFQEYLLCLVLQVRGFGMQRVLEGFGCRVIFVEQCVFYWVFWYQGFQGQEEVFGVINMLCGFSQVFLSLVNRRGRVGRFRYEGFYCQRGFCFGCAFLQTIEEGFLGFGIRILWYEVFWFLFFYVGDVVFIFF